MSGLIHDLRSRRGWALMAVALPIAASILAIVVALPPPSTDTGDVCQMGLNVARQSMDDSDAVQGSESGPDQVTAGDVGAALERVDFDLLAESVPADLRDDVERGRDYVAALRAATKAGDPPPAPTEEDLAALRSVVTWYGRRCT